MIAREALSFGVNSCGFVNMSFISLKYCLLVFQLSCSLILLRIPLGDMLESSLFKSLDSLDDDIYLCEYHLVFLCFFSKIFI